MFLEEDITCIFSDNITCIDGKCTECEIFMQKIRKKVPISGQNRQITIWELMNVDGSWKIDKKD